ncbi:MAG: CehA/McbA family metallohydrolase [Chthonomonadales bacterium]|nr:CehA/McbA family metallohydrolase [Chthonomonadales bacterium]
MQEYVPLDLSAVCNVGAAEVGMPRTPCAGAQSLRGLPFLVAGEGSTPRFVGLGPVQAAAGGPAAVPVGGAARWVLFAHALLESQLARNGPVGQVVARYLFVYADGQSVPVDVRERFEVAVTQTGWGQWPFLSVPDDQDGLQPRWQGAWGSAGGRQTEVTQGWARDYYLWAWRNPRPEAPIARIEMGPGTPPVRFIVAAITLGHADEDPFGHSAAVPVVLTLPRPADAEEPFSLEVDVDRGVATYPYALPAEPDAGFLADPARGWGEPQNPGNSPAYVEIAATPSATVTVRRGGEEVGQVRWGDLTAAGRAETERVRFEVVDTGRNWVHTTVLDDATGRPVPCRVHFRSPRGVPYAPHGHHAHVNSNLGTWHVDVGGDVRLGQITYAYIDGRCQGWLPRGEVIVDVARGYEYEPLRERVTIQPGQRELTLRLKRAADMATLRYYSGDTHVHFLSAQGALLEAAAEGVNCVNLMQSQWGHLFTNTEEFTGGPAVSADGATIVWVSQENRQHMLGHLSLLGLKQPVMPWCSDGPSEAELGGNLETTLSHWADACRAQGGTVVIPHVPNPNGEPAALIATGRVDAVEMLVHDPYFHGEYYRYLNAGYRLPLVGGTDKMDSAVPVGIYRTYAHIPPDRPLTYESWMAAVRGGNTFHSGGPLLRFTVDGQPIGSTLRMGAGGGTVEVEAVATSVLPIHALQVVQGGRVVAQVEEAAGARDLRLRERVRVEGDAWLCARCAGPGYTSWPHFDGWRRGLMAHTSPVYVACGGDYDPFDHGTMQYMLTLIDGSLQYLRQRAPQWKPGDVTHHHGEADHQAYLERPFHEAIAAIHRRMHAHGVPH